MLVHQLKVEAKTKTKRIGRGGKTGTYCGRGGKGQSARKGYSQRATFEGGSTSIVSFSKKNRGFKALNKKSQVVSLDRINANFSAGEVVDKAALLKKKIISDPVCPVKILSDGGVDKKLSFQGLKISKKGIEKIEKAGGKVELPVAVEKKGKKSKKEEQ